MSVPEFPKKPASRLDRLAARAGWTIVWERVWPVAATLLTLGGFFLAISFLGLWLETPRWGRILGVVIFGLLALAALAPLAFMKRPDRSEKLARIDRDSGLPHRPATAMEDQLANEYDDPTTRMLWELHRQRMERAAQALTLRLPSPRLAERDRYALRSFALVAVAATAFVAGPEKYARVLAAFDWRTEGALSQGYRLDAWVDPPGYTGKPPVILNLRDETGAKANRRVPAPIGSTIVVRSSQGSNVSVEVGGALEVGKAEAKAVKAEANDSEMRWSLKGDGKLVLKRFGSIITTFDLNAIPDRAPTISLKGEATANSRGSLTLGYTIDDDYGVTDARADFAKPVMRGKAVTGRTLVGAPKIDLALPAGSGGIGEAQTTADLSEHPWAGARVTMTLSARDEGGNEGLSDPVEVTLPQRTFVKPLAKALVEQRRNLVLAPDERGRVLGAIKALMIAPDQFGVAAGVYLGFHNIANRLTRARKDVDLLAVADFMWEMALRIEDGGLSDAERELRAAQQQLRDALNRGAPQDEISKLMEQMRAALDKFLNELAQQADRQDREQQPQNRADNDSRTVTPQDLQSMLDRIEEMMRNGQMAEAQRMMEQLQNLLENLQTARRQRGSDPMAREMNRALDELDQMTRDQQELRDNTFRNQNGKQRRQAQRGDRKQQGMQQGRPGQKGQQGDQDDGDEDEQSADGQDGQSLQQRQEALRQRLDQLQRRMKELGMKGDQSLDDAEGAMKEAEGELGKGEPGRGKAVDAQGRALEALRKGAQAMAQQMQPGPGDENGPGDPNGPMRQGRSGQSDPLGRESHDKRDNSRALYDPLGTPAAQRAQKVLEELRRRLSDPARPREELDYLERLLKRY